MGCLLNIAVGIVGAVIGGWIFRSLKLTTPAGHPFLGAVLVSFVATYRPTLEFFARKDDAMAEFYPEPFPHWVRGERHFNLVSRDTRRVIRFEASKFVARAEGHSTMKPYDELIAICTKLFKVFDVRDLFGSSRKYVLALLELLDRQRVTRRVGDDRVLV